MEVNPDGVQVGMMAWLNAIDVAKARHSAEYKRLVSQLTAVRNAGVSAITVDIWWGLVAPKKGEKTYDWKGTKSFFDTLIKLDFSIFPILSTHECGESINDTFNVRLPEHVNRDQHCYKSCIPNGEHGGHYTGVNIFKKLEGRDQVSTMPTSTTAS